MSEAERWAANQKLLDRMIARGDEIVLATPLNQVPREVILLVSWSIWRTEDMSRALTARASS